MLRLLFVFVALVTMFTSGSNALPEGLKDKVMFEAYNNGEKIVISEENASEIDRLFCCSLKGCRVMPALGVSLHDETMQAIEEGIWLRFAFDEKLEINGLHFDQLLIKVTKDMYGFNIIRGNKGKFDGRCFYIDIKHNMDDLYSYLLSLPVGDEKFEALPDLAELKPEKEVNHTEEVEDDFEERVEIGTEEALVDTLKSGEFGDNGVLANTVAGRIEIPSVNKDKEKQNTVIWQSGVAPEKKPGGQRPPLDELTFWEFKK